MTKYLKIILVISVWLVGLFVIFCLDWMEQSAIADRTRLALTASYLEGLNEALPFEKPDQRWVIEKGLGDSFSLILAGSKRTVTLPVDQFFRHVLENSSDSFSLLLSDSGGKWNHLLGQPFNDFWGSQIQFDLPRTNLKMQIKVGTSPLSATSGFLAAVLTLISISAVWLLRKGSIKLASHNRSLVDSVVPLVEPVSETFEDRWHRVLQTLPKVTFDFLKIYKPGDGDLFNHLLKAIEQVSGTSVIEPERDEVSLEQLSMIRPQLRSDAKLGLVRIVGVRRFLRMEIVSRVLIQNNLIDQLDPCIEVVGSSVVIRWTVASNLDHLLNAKLEEFLAQLQLGQLINGEWEVRYQTAPVRYGKIDRRIDRLLNLH